MALAELNAESSASLVAANDVSPSTADSSFVAALQKRVSCAVEKRRASYRSPRLRRGYMMQFQEIERAVIDEVRTCTGGDLSSQQILDIGCGAGGWLREFVKWGAKPANLVGVDALHERIDEARAMCPADIRLICGSAEKLEFDDESFDLIMIFESMSLILEQEVRERVAAEAVRVLKRNGAILWYDFRYQRPEMKGLLAPVTEPQLRRLFPGCELRLKSIHPFPPISRRLAEIWRPAWYLLDIIPPLRTCYVGTITKKLT